MRRKNQKRRRNRRIILLFIFVLLTIIAIIVFYKQEKNDNSNVNHEENITTVIVEETKVDNIKENDTTNYELDEHKTIQYDGDNPNTLDLLTGAITYSEISGDKLVIRLNIDQYLTNGTCQLSIIQNGKEQYNDTTNIIETASSSTCEGFDVLVSDLLSGEATINIQLISGDKIGSLSRVVNI